MSQDLERWRLIQLLLRYHGWLYHPKSDETKIWAETLKKLIGDGPHGTYDFQPYLPHQPLPDLGQSLNKFLKVTELLVSQEDFHITKMLVEDFQRNEGPILQAHLQKKAATEVNWLADYWLHAKYLSSRDPVAICSNPFFVARRIQTNAPGRLQQLTRTAANICSFVILERDIRTSRFPVRLMNGLVPLCMDGYKNIFNTTRIPGEPVDKLQNFPFHSNHHVIVIRKGHYFKLSVYVEDTKGEIIPLSCNEIQSQLQYIVSETENLEFGTSVAALTTQGRSVWAKQREILKQRNNDVLAAVEKSMFVVCLDTDENETREEFTKLVYTGDGTNRWFDKSLNLVTNADGDSGINVNHTGVDGTVFASVAEHWCASENVAHSKGIHLADNTPPLSSTLAKPVRLKWDLEDLEESVSHACDNFKEKAAMIDLTTVKSPYGSGFIKTLKMSPSGYIQMVMQLAYYRLHKETPKTNELALSRLFALGRTEAVHPESKYSVEWVKVMDDKSVTKERKVDLLRKSVNQQHISRLDCTAGQGFDRHMLALQCAAKELEIHPTLFMDKSLRMPTKLLTSRIPMELDCDVVDGGFPPLTVDGYGILFWMTDDEILKFTITNWKQSGLSGKKMGDAILMALKDMQVLFLKSNM